MQRLEPGIYFVISGPSLGVLSLKRPDVTNVQLPQTTHLH